MMEQKIEFTVVRIRYDDRKKDICRATVMVKDGIEERSENIVYACLKLELDKKYEGVVNGKFGGNALRVKEISAIYNVATMVKEVLIDDIRISKEVCEDIVNKFGEQSLDLFVKNSGALIDLDMMNENKSKYLSEKVIKYAETVRVKEYFKLYCIESTIADKIYNQFGEKSIGIINNNPYLLLSYEINLRIVDNLANNLEISYNDKKRVMHGIIEYLKHISNTYGHVYTIQEDLIENLNEYVNKYGGYLGNPIINKDLIIEAIDNLERENEVIRYLNADNGKCVYLKELYECEFGVAEIISDMLLEKVEVSKEIVNKIDNFINSYSDENFKLTKEQGIAVKNAIKERVSILYGFPGTGKTNNLTAITQCIRSIYKDSKIKVVAFTGKACSRIKGILPEDIEVKTIHRLLGLGSNKKMNSTEIDVDFLIIDEATLIDVKLFHNLLKCCIKENTKVLIVGDEQQISMGVGKTFCDLISCKEIKKVKLTKIFRQGEGSVILKNIQKMANGIGFNDNNGLKCKKGEFEFIEVQREKDFQNKIEDIMGVLIKEGKSLMDIQILSPIKESLAGTKKINKLVQEKFNYNSRRVMHKYNLVIGDRVMQNLNDYNNKVFNGETGLIISSVDDESNRRLVVRFSNNKLVEYVGETIKDIESSYSITVHRSQGSQFPIVIIPVFKEHRLNLNLLYTACSRAENQVFLIGNKEAFELAIKNPQLIKDSNLTELIDFRIKASLGRTA